MLRSPRRLARQQDLTLRLNERSVRRDLHKDMHYQPYKIQDAQELKARDNSSGLFPGILISHFGDIIWPARSPDLAVPDSFLRVYVESAVHATRPANIDDLEHRILERIQRIPKEMLQRVMTAFPSRLQECTERRGGHLQCVVFKQ